LSSPIHLRSASPVASPSTLEDASTTDSANSRGSWTKTSGANEWRERISSSRERTANLCPLDDREAPFCFVAVTSRSNAPVTWGSRNISHHAIFLDICLTYLRKLVKLPPRAHKIGIGQVTTTYGTRGMPVGPSAAIDTLANPCLPRSRRLGFAGGPS